MLTACDHESFQASGDCSGPGAECGAPSGPSDFMFAFLVFQPAVDPLKIMARTAPVPYSALVSLSAILVSFKLIKSGQSSRSTTIINHRRGGRCSKHCRELGTARPALEVWDALVF